MSLNPKTNNPSIQQTRAAGSLRGNPSRWLSPLMLGVRHLRALLLVSLLLAGCSKQPTPPTATSPAPVVILASNERGRPQFDYSGPDSLSYKYSFDTFTFQIGQWGSVKGEMKLGVSNDVAITIQSTSDRAFDIQFWGLSTTNNFDLQEENLKETVHVSAGDQKVKIERFVIYTYDFAK